MLLHLCQLMEAVGENTEVTDDSCPEDKFWDIKIAACGLNLMKPLVISFETHRYRGIEV